MVERAVPCHQRAFRLVEPGVQSLRRCPPGTLKPPKFIPMREVVLVVSVALVSGMYAPPRAVVDECEPEATRWGAAVNASLSAHPWQFGFGPVFQAHNASLFDHLSSEQLEDLGNWTRTNNPSVAAQLDGMAQAFRSHPNGGPVTYEYLVGWLWFHELAHTELSTAAQPKACCGILSAATNSSTVTHVRNMDQTPAQVRNVTVQLTIRRSCDPGWQDVEVVDWYWITTGFMTAVLPGVASVEENWRFASVKAASVFAAAERGVLPQVLLFRKALLAGAEAKRNGKDGFEAALGVIAQTPLAAPMYAILAGPKPLQGAVVTRDLDGPAPPIDTRGIAMLADAPLGPQGAGRTLVQTNYDRWLPDPPGDARRTAALATLASMPSGIAASPVGALAAASTYPVFNADTAYTAVLCSASNCPATNNASLAAFTRQLLLPPRAE